MLYLTNFELLNLPLQYWSFKKLLILFTLRVHERDPQSHIRSKNRRAIKKFLNPLCKWSHLLISYLRSAVSFNSIFLSFIRIHSYWYDAQFLYFFCVQHHNFSLAIYANKEKASCNLQIAGIVYDNAKGRSIHTHNKSDPYLRDVFTVEGKSRQ